MGRKQDRRAYGTVAESAKVANSSVSFIDLFENTGPGLDATKWTEKVRAGGGGLLGNGSSSVNVAVASKMVAQRVSGANKGGFVGFVTALEPAESFSISFKMTMSGAINWNELRFKCTDKLANVPSDGPTSGYVIKLLPTGNNCQVRRHDAGWPGSQIGSNFDSGMADGVESIVTVTISVLADRVRIVVVVDGDTKITADDTSELRITAKGYTGIAIEATTSSSAYTTIDDFIIN